MDDGIAAIAVPQAATAYVRPSALVFTVEGGRRVLHVTHGREETLRLLADKRACTRDERYLFSIEVVESSVMPERSGQPTVTVVSPAVGLLMDAAFEIMPHFEEFQELVYDGTLRLEAFVLPPAPEVESGFGVVRAPSGPLLEMFHSREQAVSFLKRHEALMSAAESEEADAAFGRSPLVGRSKRTPEAFGGFAAALIGTRYHLWRMIRQKMLGQ